MAKLIFKSDSDLNQAIGAMLILGIDAKPEFDLNKPKVTTIGFHGVPTVVADIDRLKQAITKDNDGSLIKKLCDVITAPAVKQKKFKDRTYLVEIGPTTHQKAVVITDAILSGFKNIRAKMTLVQDNVTRTGVGVSSCLVSFKVRYEARGNCPADIRGMIKRMLANVDTTAVPNVTPVN